MNNISLMGRLTKDIELKQTTNGISVCSFSVAVKRPKVKDTTDFINCVAWRQTAEFVTKYFGKGSMIALTGVLTSRKYEDSDGKNHVIFEVVVDNVEFCESKKKDETSKPTNAPEFEEIEESDDLPF